MQEACGAIAKDWTAHGAQIRESSAAEKQAATPQPAAAPIGAPAPTVSTGKLSIVSTPDGADIEIDGNFVGNAPSTLQIAEGDHMVTVKKGGFKDWERKLKVSAGSDVHLSAELEKAATSAQ